MRASKKPAKPELLRRVLWCRNEAGSRRGTRGSPRKPPCPHPHAYRRKKRAGLCVKTEARPWRGPRGKCAVCDLRSEAVATDRAHRRAAAAIAEQRERIDGDARGANLFENGPERL